MKTNRSDVQSEVALRATTEFLRAFHALGDDKRSIIDSGIEVSEAMTDVVSIFQRLRDLMKFRCGKETRYRTKSTSDSRCVSTSSWYCSSWHIPCHMQVGHDCGGRESSQRAEPGDEGASGAQRKRKQSFDSVPEDGTGGTAERIGGSRPARGAAQSRHQGSCPAGAIWPKNSPFALHVDVHRPHEVIEKRLSQWWMERRDGVTANWSDGKLPNLPCESQSAMLRGSSISRPAPHSAQ